MEIERLNIYERLRDFKVPSPILDSIFSDESDAAILIDAFKTLVDDGFKEDQAAEKISEMIFKELKINPNQSMEDEK
tara:strand:+ start:135 stop:365 length:231 start_codon:yes stop_codon:yes gene_type:complete